MLNDYWEENIQPKINGLYLCIRNDIAECLKEERKKYGSICKRFGNWNNFLNKKMLITQLEYNEKYLFQKKLYYRGELIGEYVFKWRDK